MPFKEASATNVRNLKNYKIIPSPAFNLVVGNNGAGKSNILEALYLNASGRSFRTHLSRNIIQEGQQSCSVFSRFQKGANSASIDAIGVEYQKGNQQKIIINGSLQSSKAALVKNAPIILIEPSESALIEGSSTIRRKYLDWLVFHVEHSFLDLWRKNQQILKQRNRLLRQLSKQQQPSKQDLSQLSSWTAPFVSSSESLSRVRALIAKELFECVYKFLPEIPGLRSLSQHDDNSGLGILELSFYPGWKEGASLQEVLEGNVSQDINRGFTHYGAHRGDIVLKANKKQVKDFLSRGQQKLLSILLRLAQAKTFKLYKNEAPVLIIDDLFAEIDQDNVEALLPLFESLGAQVFMTALDAKQFNQSLLTSECKVFHVKHGVLEAK